MKKCKICHEPLRSKKYENICCSCWAYFKAGRIVHRPPLAGTVAYDKEGNMICHICGKSYPKLGAHIRSAHKMTAKEYKKKFGLSLSLGLCSEKIKEQLREHVDKDMVQKNLVQGGIKSRFLPKSKGRTKDEVSLQTLKALQNNAKTLRKKKKL